MPVVRIGELVFAIEDTFITPWMGLNQRNFRKYEEEIVNSNKKEEIEFIRSILIGNILSFTKGVDWWVEKDIKLYPDLERITIMFKNQEMIGFKGFFIQIFYCLII